MSRRNLLLIGFLLMGCSEQEPRGVCGESFCLPSTAKFIEKTTPIDFNLYQLEWKGDRFGIYEGNNPQRDLAGRSTKLRLTMDRSATLHVSGGRGRVLVQVKTECRIGEDCGPQYLDVAGPCRSSEQCQVRDFAAQLSRR